MNCKKNNGKDLKERQAVIINWLGLLDIIYRETLISIIQFKIDIRSQSV